MIRRRDIIIFLIIEIILTGIGMGIPIFLIAFGFLIGIFITKRIIKVKKRNHLKMIFKYSIITSIPTFIIMLIIWGTYAVGILNQSYSITNSGIPMILYEPTPSFIGWIILMTVISSFLQFLMTILGAWIVLMNTKQNP